MLATKRCYQIVYNIYPKWFTFQYLKHKFQILLPSKINFYHQEISKIYSKIFLFFQWSQLVSVFFSLVSIYHKKLSTWCKKQSLETNLYLTQETGFAEIINKSKPFLSSFQHYKQQLFKQTRLISFNFWFKVKSDMYWCE